jgi:hypothetical protein
VGICDRMIDDLMIDVAIDELTIAASDRGIV